jgi:hypothetical protein
LVAAVQTTAARTEETMKALTRRVIPIVPFLLVVLAILGQAKPARADDYHCFEDLASCYQRAAVKETVTGMWLAGLDCELTAVNCVRRAIVY